MIFTVNFNFHRCDLPALNITRVVLRTLHIPQVLFENGDARCFIFI